MNVISLFSSIGVAEYYFKDLCINVIVASDIDKRRCDVHKFLYPDTAMVSGDIREDETKYPILDAVKRRQIDSVISTPPCQGMCSVGKNRSYTALATQADKITLNAKSILWRKSKVGQQNMILYKLA